MQTSLLPSPALYTLESTNQCFVPGAETVSLHLTRAKPGLMLHYRSYFQMFASFSCRLSYFSWPSGYLSSPSKHVIPNPSVVLLLSALPPSSFPPSASHDYFILQQWVRFKHPHLCIKSCSASLCLEYNVYPLLCDWNSLISEFISCICFWDWVTSLSMIISRCIDLPAKSMLSCF